MPLGNSQIDSPVAQIAAIIGVYGLSGLVALPMIAQSLVSAWLLTFTISLDDVVLSAFLSGPGSTTMPLVIFSRARLGVNPSVNAMATVIISVVFIGVITASYLIARAERERSRAMAQAQRDGG